MSAGKIGTLRSPLIHHSFSKGIHDWLEKHNRYSLAEAVHLMQKEKGRRWILLECSQCQTRCGAAAL